MEMQNRSCGGAGHNEVESSIQCHVPGIHDIFAFPAIWLLALPVNFVVDSAVLLLAIRYNHCAGANAIWKKSILRVWLLGFVADFAGAALITSLFFALDALNISVYHSWYAEMLIALPGVALAGWLIFLMDKKWAFRKIGLDYAQSRRLAFALAIFTAPYTMMIPTVLLYR